MNVIERNYTEEVIHAFVDGQLSPDEQIRFERLLDADNELQQKVNSYQRQNKLLHEAFDPLLLESRSFTVVPQAIQRKQNNIFLSAVASIFLMLLGSVIGYHAKDNQQHQLLLISGLAQSATRAHMVYVPEIKHPVEVSAKQDKHLVGWLSKRLGSTVNTPSLNQVGFQLVGGRLLPSDNGPAAQFMYENNNGERLTLFVKRKKMEQQNTAFRFYNEDDTNTFYWIDGNLGYALVGSQTRNELQQTAIIIYRQLSEL